MRSWPDNINSAMALLGSERPIFHSEADFQFSLAWAIRTIEPDVQFRLEYPVGNGMRGAVDIVAVEDGKPVYALELKYVKTRTRVDVAGERFDLPDSLSDSYYFVCKDVARMEQFAAANPEAGAGVLILSNRLQSWQEWRRVQGCHPFRISDGRTLTGVLDWPAERDRERLGRDMRQPVEIKGRYPLSWRRYGAPEPGQFDLGFRYLLIEVNLKGDQVPAISS